MRILGTGIVLILFAAGKLSAQQKFSPERIALYHLDSLVKVDSAYFNVRFKTDGTLTQYKTDSTNVFWIRASKARHLDLKFRYRNIVINEDTSIKKIDVNGRRKRRKGYSLAIHHYLKMDGLYYVGFSLPTSKYGGYFITIVLDGNGDMVNNFISSYII